MRIAILSRNAQLYSTRRLLEAGLARGHEVQIIDTLSVTVNFGRAGRGNDMQLVGRGGHGRARAAAIPDVDAIVPRIGASITEMGVAVVAQFEARGVLTAASAEAIAQSRNKLVSLQLMANAGLPVPRTAIIGKAESLLAAVDFVGGTPVVIKLLTGTQGRGVVLARNVATAAAVLRTIRNAKRQALVQEFISEAQGRDLRVIVVGGRVVAAMERIAARGEFRANLHQGGEAISAEIDDHTHALAVQGAHVHGLDVAGVDLIQSRRGPLLLEVNSSPGLEGIETITGVDVADAIMGHLTQAMAAREQARATADEL